MSQDQYDQWNEEGNEHGAQYREHAPQHERGDGEILSAHERNRFAQDAFREAGNGLANAEIGKEKKFLGMFKMDAGLVDMLDGVYNFGADYASTKLRPEAFRIVENLALRVAPERTKAAKTAAAIATIGSTAALKMGGQLGTITGGVSSQIKTQRQLARKIAPVLDEMKGNHSLIALRSVDEKDNEVIFVQRKRLDRIANTSNLTNVINLGINSGTSLVFDVKNMAGIWNNRERLSHVDVNRIVTAKAGDAAAEQAAQAAESSDGKQVLKAGMLGMLPQAAARISKTSQYKLRKELQPFSALEMILELNEQVASNPDARGFAMPSSFQSPNSHRQECPLEEYLIRICRQHQKDMADINPEHTEIRDALREDLAAAVQPIAKAIRKGDMNVMSLIRMVGEGKIIKKHGRAIASPEEIMALLEKEAPKQAAYTHIDPTEHYKNAAYSREQFKKTLTGFKGEEKLAFAAIFPDSILADAGMSKQEIKQVNDYRAKGADGKGYDHQLAYEMLGLNAKEDAQLDGMLAKAEIKKMRDDAAQIVEGGVAAVHDLKTSPTHENGIETVLANVLVHKPEYMGTILKDGRKQFAEIAANDSKASEAANDEQYSHVERENQRRTGTDDLYAGRD